MAYLPGTGMAIHALQINIVAVYVVCTMIEVSESKITRKTYTCLCLQICKEYYMISVI